LECGDGLVDFHQMRHHRFQIPLPFTGRPRTRTTIRSEFAGFFVIQLLGMQHRERTAGP
jgi:hypothetical protein